MASSSSASLFKDHDKFVKRQAEAAAFLDSAEKRQKTEKSNSQKAARPKSTLGRSRTSGDLIGEYRMPSTNTPRLRIRQLLVDKMKERYLSENTEPLTIDEMIAEISVAVDPSDRHWLASQALLESDRLDVKKVDDENKFVYKPPLNLKNAKKQSLLNLLKARHEAFEGGISVEDIRDTVMGGRADTLIDNLIKSGEAIKVIGANKKEVLFYTDREFKLQLDPEFIDCWRKTSVEGLDNKKIGDFLDAEGHRALTKTAPRAVQMSNKSTKRARRHDALKCNLHVADRLEDYSNMSTKK